MDAPDQPTAFTQLMGHNLEEHVRYQQTPSGSLASQKADYAGQGLPQKLMSENNWIKISDRRPCSEDMPFVLGAYTKPTGEWTQLYCGTSSVCLDSWSHWMPQLKIPAPPPKELTLHQRDFAVYTTWWNQNGFSPKADSWPAWNSGVCYERAAIRSMLEKYNHGADLIRHLQERVKL